MWYLCRRKPRRILLKILRMYDARSTVLKYHFILLGNSADTSSEVGMIERHENILSQARAGCFWKEIFDSALKDFPTPKDINAEYYFP